MRIAFIMRSVGYLRNYEWAIRRLAAKGHVILLYSDREKKAVDRMQESSDKAAQDHLEVMMREVPRVKYHSLHNAYSKPISLLTVASRRIRLIQDFARYFDPQFDDASKLRDRAGSFMKPSTRRLIATLAKPAWSRRLMMGTLGRLEALIPPRADVVAFLERTKPDLLLVAPLLGHGSSQVDYFKAASAMGLRSCLPVASWDNLTSKGIVQCEPASVLVWNDAQKREAMELQGIPEERITVTGAHCYEHWFTWEPSTDKAAFLAQAGLDAGKDYVLFLGSSRFIAENEPPVVLRWAEAIRRSSDPQVRDIGILIRPHPQNYGAWANVDLSHLGNVVVFPRGGSNHNPVSREAKSEYFDTMYHCSAVVGVNTSGMIEAAILGKAVHTVLFDEMAATQEGTLHFHHLSDAEDGMLRVAPDLDAHVRMLGESLRDPAADIARSKAFVERFVWPKDLRSKTMVGTFVNALLSQYEAPVQKPSRWRKPLVWGARIVASPLLLVYFPEHLRLTVRRRYRRREIEAAKAQVPQG